MEDDYYIRLSQPIAKWHLYSSWKEARSDGINFDNDLI